MSGVELKANDAKALPAIKRRSVLSSIHVLPILVTAVAVVVAAVAGWQGSGTSSTRPVCGRAAVITPPPRPIEEVK